MQERESKCKVRRAIELREAEAGIPRVEQSIFIMIGPCRVLRIVSLELRARPSHGASRGMMKDFGGDET